MGRHIGGEFWYDDLLLKTGFFRSPAGNTFFLSGGRASVRVICEYLSEQGIARILLPFYLCPSIVADINAHAIETVYYNVNIDLSIDMDDLQAKIGTGTAVFFINYFGFKPSKEIAGALSQMKKQGALLIEDNVQGLQNASGIGDFIFNSFRKFVPYDGSYLECSVDVSAAFSGLNGAENRRLPLIRRAREAKKEFINGNNSADESYYLRLFEQAEKLYYADGTIKGDPLEEAAVKKIDFGRIIGKRRENCAALLKMIGEAPGITPVFDTLQDDCIPLALPVFVQGGKRDLIKNNAKKYGIFLPVHWDLSDFGPARDNADAMYISESILSLVIDQRYDIEDMEYEYDCIKKSMGGCV